MSSRTTFDEALVERLADIIDGTYNESDPAWNNAKNILIALSETHVVVAKGDYDLLVANLEHFRKALTEEERRGYTLTQLLVQHAKEVPAHA